MSVAPRVKSGSSRASKISVVSLRITARVARYFLSTLRQADHRLHALDLRQDQTLLSLFQSMTPEQRTEAIGLLSQLNDSVGELYVRSLRIRQSLNYSKTDSMTLPSYGGLSESECRE